MESEDLELSVLEICSQGGFVAPIGAWEDAVLWLCAQGFLRKLDPVNYVITTAGSAEFERRENAELLGVIRSQQELKKPAIEGEAEDVT